MEATGLSKDYVMIVAGALGLTESEFSRAAELYHQLRVMEEAKPCAKVGDDGETAVAEEQEEPKKRGEKLTKDQLVWSVARELGKMTPERKTALIEQLGVTEEMLLKMETGAKTVPHDFYVNAAGLMRIAV